MFGNKRKANTAGGKVAEARNGYATAREIDRLLDPHGNRDANPERDREKQRVYSAAVNDRSPHTLSTPVSKVSYGDRMKAPAEGNNAGFPAGGTGKRRQSGGPYAGGK